MVRLGCVLACALVTAILPPTVHAHKRGAPPPVHTTTDAWADSGATPIAADIGDGATPAPPAAPDPEMEAAKTKLMELGEGLVVTKVAAKVQAAVALVDSQVPAWQGRCCTNGLSCDYAAGMVNSDTEENNNRADACSAEFNASILPSIKTLQQAKTDPQGLARATIDEMLASGDPEFTRIARGLDQIEKIEQHRRDAAERYRRQMEKLHAERSRWDKCAAGELRQRKHCLDVLFDGVREDLPDQYDTLKPAGTKFFGK